MADQRIEKGTKAAVQAIDDEVNSWRPPARKLACGHPDCARAAKYITLPGGLYRCEEHRHDTL